MQRSDSVCGLPKTSHQLDGKDISPGLADPTAKWKHPAITTYGENKFSLRSGQWRYIRYRNGSKELYHHSKDPHEFKNISSRLESESIRAKFRGNSKNRWVAETDSMLVEASIGNNHGRFPRLQQGDSSQRHPAHLLYPWSTEPLLFIQRQHNS